MSSGRIDRMREMVAKSPEDARARYFLAHELFKLQDWTGAAEHYRAYLDLAADEEGAGFKSYGQCLEHLGRVEEAAEAYRRGIAAAQAHHHEGLAGEIAFLLEQIEDAAS
jgi:thioredoxin-like negative regulator of GroEL